MKFKLFLIMTPQKFIDSWAGDDEPLAPLSLIKLGGFNLSKPTIDFLTIAGLPKYADPHLSFVNDSEDKFYGISRLVDIYDLFDKKAEFAKYIVIGFCNDGDVIAINTKENDQIEGLDHEDLFRPYFFNSSINSLADFLIVYKDFRKAVLAEKDPDDGMQFYNFTDTQFETLKEIMLNADEKAVQDNGFWKNDLEGLISIREEYFRIQ